MLRKPLELNSKAGDKILIITDTGMEPVLWQGLAAAAREMGIEPVVAIMPPREAPSTDPVSAIRRAALDPEIDLCVYLTSTAMAHAPMTEDLVQHRKSFILMEELTTAMLDPDGPAGADYDAIKVLGDKLAKLFTDGRQVRVTCPNGTDLTASIAGRPGRSISGVPLQLRPGLGGGCAFPDGEAHVCPVEGAGEGVIVFDMTAHVVGKIGEPIRVTVEKGRAVEIAGGREASLWREVLDRHGDANSYNCPAEIAIGTNPKVKPTGSMRSDKKKYGTSHIGLGDTIALGGACHARLPLEGVISRPEISIDGRIVTRGGKILV